MRDEAANLIFERKRKLAERLVSLQYRERPDLEERYGAQGRQKCLEDAEYHFASLAETIRFDCTPLFVDYVGWAKIVLLALGIPMTDLERHLETMLKVIGEMLPREAGDLAEPQIEVALKELPNMPSDTTSFLQPQNPKIELTRQWLDALLRRDALTARRLILNAAAEGANLLDLYTLVFAPSLQEIGRLWQVREIDEALEHYCSETTYTTLAILTKRPGQHAAKTQGSSRPLCCLRTAQSGLASGAGLFAGRRVGHGVSRSQRAYPEHPANSSQLGAARSRRRGHYALPLAGIQAANRRSPRHPNTITAQSHCGRTPFRHLCRPVAKSGGGCARPELF